MPGNLAKKVSDHARSGWQGDREAGPGCGSALSELLEPLLENAPLLVRRRTFLPSFDWSEASSSQVERLLASLSGAGCNVPEWLAKSLLVGGHSLPPSALAHCSLEIAALAALNEVDDHGLPDGMTRQILDGAQSSEFDPGIALAMVKRLLARGEAALACRVALSQARAAPEVMRAVRACWPDHIATMPALRLLLTGVSSTHALASALQPAFAAIDFRVEIAESDYSTYLAVLMSADDASDGLLLLLDPSLFSESLGRPGNDADARLAQERIDILLGAIERYCGATSQSVLLNTLPAPPLPRAGHVDVHHAAGEARLCAEVNRRLAELAARTGTLFLVDADVALSQLAPSERCDPKLWFYGRQAYSDAAMRALAHAFARAWQAKERGPAKVLALDFDNTLWGGVFGDDDMERLACGDDFPGNAFKALQQECLRLKGQGMLLVGLSKNNPDALQVFDRHPGMALRRDDFVATAVNWEPKPDNIRHIAGELGLGLESFLFLDDSPHERDAMRRMCPGVNVPELPTDPAKRPLWLRSLASTWPLRLTEEDARRSDMYITERKGKELKEAVQDYDAYLAGLQQRLIVRLLTPDTLARAAQLHQRTNQFNLTTKRLTEAEIARFMGGAERGICLIGQVCDRFGDHGIVLSSCVSIRGELARIETFLMSCRVIGRQVELAFLSAVAGRLAGLGIRNIQGLYRASAKNGIARDLYPSAGFTRAGDDEEAELWELAAGTGPETCAVPKHITVEWRTE